jgi:hypothetical protein
VVAAEQKAQEDYDKTVLALSGGALGITFAFVTDLVGQKPIVWPTALLVAWVAWGVSVTCVLGSFFFSQQALRRTIDQLDASRIREEHPGGVFSKVTAILNALGGVLFLAGVVSTILFVAVNWR